MAAFKQQVVTDSAGKPVGVFLDLEEFRRIVSELEELDDIRTFDEAKGSREKPVPFDQAVAEIERNRK